MYSNDERLADLHPEAMTILGCAQCHDHKFDPITHREYYGLMAFLDDHAEQPEVPVFRPFIESMWKSQPERWGEMGSE